MAARIKKDDLVYVVSGDDKGKTGKVRTILLGKGQVIVEGINVKTKHVKPTQTSRGGRLQVERPIAMCKVQPVDPKTVARHAGEVCDRRRRQEAPGGQNRERPGYCQ